MTPSHKSPYIPTYLVANLTISSSIFPNIFDSLNRRLILQALGWSTCGWFSQGPVVGSHQCRCWWLRRWEHSSLEQILGNGDLVWSIQILDVRILVCNFWMSGFLFWFAMNIFLKVVSVSGCFAKKTITRWWFQRFFIFTPNWGNDPIWRLHIFQRGWFNHQLDKHLLLFVQMWKLFHLPRGWVHHGWSYAHGVVGSGYRCQNVCVARQKYKVF